jgi:protein CpxP
MNHRRILAAVLAASLGVGTMITVSAQPQPAPERPRMEMQRGPGGFGPMRGPRAGFGLRGLRQLDLTDAQREQIRNIRQSHREEGRTIAERLRTAQRELRQAGDVMTVDEAAIRSKAEALAAALTDSTLHRARVQAEIYNVLTPEQQEKLKAFRAAQEERMKQREARRQQRRQR